MTFLNLWRAASIALAALLLLATPAAAGWKRADTPRFIVYSAGDTAAAEENYRAAIRADSTCVEAHFKLGRLLFRRGDHAGAEESLRAASNASASALLREIFQNPA